MTDELEKKPNDMLTLTVRLHDHKEKQNHEMAASWGVMKVPRSELEMSFDEFVEKYVKPALKQVVNHGLK